VKESRKYTTGKQGMDCVESEITDTPIIGEPNE